MTLLNRFAFSFMIILLVACRNNGPVEPPLPTDIPAPLGETATPLPSPVPTERYYPATASEIDFITVAIDAPSRNLDFSTIDEFGRVQGFDPDLMRQIAAEAGFDVEFVVTPLIDINNPDGGLLNRVAEGEFDVGLASLPFSETTEPGPVNGLVYTNSYLEVGQVLVVRANDVDINNYRELPVTSLIGIEAGSHGEQIARDQLQIPENRFVRYDSPAAALQGLIDQEVTGAIVDSENAKHYVDSYYQQLRIAGGDPPTAWLASTNYRMAVSEQHRALLELLNSGIETQKASGYQEVVRSKWLVSDDRLIAGESLIGTLKREVVIGMVTDPPNLDPVANPDPISWEIKTNLMSGLVGYSADNELVPMLAEALPTISPNRLEYTFRLRAGLLFADGERLTAEDVKYSIMRSAAAGNFLVNAFLKDENIDGFADEDAIQVIDTLTVRLILDEPTSYFLSVLATPPYFVVSQNCFPFEQTPNSLCGGIGPYILADYEPDQQMRLRTNENWPLRAEEGEGAADIQIRFYGSDAEMGESLSNGAIDIAWSGLSLDTIEGLEAADSGFKRWLSPGIFKSYLVFEHDSEPWDAPEVRQAAAYAIDREALSALFGGTRLPLFSPIPDQVPGHQQAEPTRNLDQARALLTSVGYSAENPARFTLDYVTDGRYSTVEESYATLIKGQLEETGLFEVELRGAPYDAFRAQSATCQSGAFLLGWPPSGQPPYYNDPAHWTYYFLFNTDTLCSNYENPLMAETVAALDQLEPGNLAERQTGWNRMQELWAADYPTLDLTQEVRLALSLSKVTAIKIDAQGFMRYETLRKES